MSNPIHSTGRGGAGNIAHDPNTYTDGSIVREGAVGDQGDGAYSAGRGGVGNINSPHMKPTKGQAGDADVVPETAIRKPGEEYDNYHTGVSGYNHCDVGVATLTLNQRGGQGNIHREHEQQGEHKESVVDKIKDKAQQVLHKDKQ